jgi:hypothetical protein
MGVDTGFGDFPPCDGATPTREAQQTLRGGAPPMTSALHRHAGVSFDYFIANPPYGKDWKRDEDAVRAEHERLRAAPFAGCST